MCLFVSVSESVWSVYRYRLLSRYRALSLCLSLCLSLSLSVSVYVSVSVSHRVSLCVAVFVTLSHICLRVCQCRIACV